MVCIIMRIVGETMVISEVSHSLKCCGSHCADNDSISGEPLNLKTFIQMSAVYWYKVFAFKKSKAHYSAEEGLNKEVFLSYVKARDISFQAVYDKMRFFRDKYGEGKYSLEEITELFKQAVSVVEAFEHASSTRGLLEEYWKAKNSDRVCAVR